MMTETAGGGKCPECGLGTDARVPPRARFWTIGRAGPLGLLVVLLLAVVVGSAWTAKQGTYALGGYGYPAFLGASASTSLGSPSRLTSFRQLERIASSEGAPTFTIQEIIDQAEDRTQYPGPASRLMVMAWPNAPGQVMTLRRRGWPLAWYVEGELRICSDVRSLALGAAGAPTPRSATWSLAGLAIEHAGNQALSRWTSYSFSIVLVVLAETLLAGWVAALLLRWIARARRANDSRAVRWVTVGALSAFALVLCVGLGWPSSQVKVYGFPDVSRRREMDLCLSDLKKMRHAPNAERELARALVNELAAPAAPPGSGSSDARAATPEMLVLFGFHDQSNSSVSETFIGWPLGACTWEHLERTSDRPEMEVDSGWRLRRLGTGEGLVALIKEEGRQPHVVRALRVELCGALPLLAMIIFPSLLTTSARAAWVHMRTRRRRARGWCVACGYALAGLERRPTSAGAAP